MPGFAVKLHKTFGKHGSLHDIREGGKEMGAGGESGGLRRVEMVGIKFHFKWLRPVSPCVSADVAEECFLYSIFRAARFPCTIFRRHDMEMAILKNCRVGNNVSIYKENRREKRGERFEN